ncbi:NACHT domain-containing protein [Rivularia sp. UHCC 0363]|uniref:NACHT domain-containing protein n=1 Tax=Rivularia sp. UHCC 0363 TaxID=3110244 RepID=UPI002B1F1715|nr:NACHT domain-containing protein [Rivularia sp. UHCC 0363]MEA5599235.1 NACHT domain-containing protein [Rivularia sp. UHCC 0363]
MLSEQLRLTTNPLTSGEGISYRTEQVYVPLGLVERKKPTRRREDVAPEQGSELYRETEITQTFEHQEFLERVLQQRQSPKSQGKRIGIIGEPGAGKTTLLQQIARWVSEEIPDAVVIWVSLADLRGRELEAYLFEVWLQAVVRKVGQAEASTQVKNDFVAQFSRGLVWLLLDGVDEMQGTVGNPLGEIERQLRTGTLLQQARIVLSCRLNLWDGGTNALDSFDNYRTLEFSYPQQVEQFIDNWFGSLPSAEIQIGQRLYAALGEPGKERIRDLAKNPLRLTLLCFNWYLSEGKLPETKAGLYEQFVADFYEWKKGQFVTTGEQRKWLNAALGELAREAIDKEATRFRLRQEFVCEYLGEPDDADSLFGLALRLGWLNKVGVDGDNPRKGVYAFFHPTFQEYFAAKDLLKLLPTFNSTQLRQNYLNLLKWTEIIALMLGFSEVAEEEAIEFIKQALDVDLMLGARLAGEVRNNFHEQTVKLILKLNVSQKLKFYLLGLTGSAKAVKPLQEAWNNKNHENAYIIAEALDKLGDDEAINTIKKSEDEHISALNEIAKHEEESNYWLCDSIVSGLEKIVSSNTGILELVISLTDKKLVSRKGSEYYLKGRNYQAKKC